MPPTSLSPFLVSTLALPLLALGCADPPDVSTTAAALGCETCGSNAPVMCGHKACALDRDGVLLNEEDVGYAGVRHPLEPEIIIDVSANRIRFLDKFNNSLRAEHDDLIGGVIDVETAEGFYALRIANVHRVWTYWTNNRLIESYELYYSGPYDEPGGEGFHCHGDFDSTVPCPEKPLCKQIDEVWAGIAPLDAAAFEGEIYHEDLSIEDTAKGGWFTLACSHSAAVKQLLTSRYRLATLLGNGTASAVQRNAMKNAWTANYCGNETAYTKTGVPLFIRDALGTIPKSHSSSWTDVDATANKMVYEAVFDENGAVCLETSRRLQDIEENPEVYDPTIPDQVKAACPTLPTCSELIPNFPKDWTAYGKVLTAFPRANLAD